MSDPTTIPEEALVRRDSVVEGDVLPTEIAYSVGATDELVDHLAYQLVEGYVTDWESGVTHYSEYAMIFRFFDNRTGKNIAIVPFNKEMHDGLLDETFDFWGYLTPQIRKTVLDYIWYENRVEWFEKYDWPLSNYLEAWEGVLTGTRSYESFKEVCEAYGVPLPTEWNEQKRRENFMTQMHDSYGYYHFLEACEWYGYYPMGHPNERGKGTWMGVLRFAVRLGMATMIGGRSDSTGQRAGRQLQRVRG